MLSRLGVGWHERKLKIVLGSDTSSGSPLVAEIRSSNCRYLYHGSKFRPLNGSRFWLCFARITSAWNPKFEQGKCDVSFAFNSVGGPRGGAGKIGRKFHSIASCLFRPVKSGVRRSQQYFEVPRNRLVGDCHPQAD